MLPSAVSDSRVHNILPNKIETDFQFSRASAATRVNHQGLIENVGYFSDELVRNGNFSELGPELIINGDFATDSNWNKQPGWSIINGKAVADLASNRYIAQNFSGGALTSGKVYKIVFTVSDYATGNLKAQFSGGGSVQDISGAINSNGNYIFYKQTVNNSTGIRFKGISSGGGFTGKIDNVSVKRVDPDDDWVLGTGWSYGDNKINFSNPTGTECFQSLSTNAGIYKISFDLDITSGTVQSSFSSPSTSTIESFTTSGTKTFNITTTASFTRFRFVGLANSVFSISNVSVVEVQGDKPRLDYDPINPTCPHLLLEPQSTNLVIFSEDYTQSSWIKSNFTANTETTIAPDGTTISGYDFGDGFLYINLPAMLNAVPYTNSVYIKANKNGTIGLRNGGAGSVSSNTDINLTTNWQRFTATSTASGGVTGRFLLDNRASNGYGVSDLKVFIYGAQNEQQSYATSYIPTAGAAETRVGETCTNAGNANTFNSTEGVLYAEIAALADDLTFRSISINDGTDNEAVIIRFRTNTNRINGLIRDGGSAINNLNFDVTDITDFHKVAYKFKTGDCALFIDGVQVMTGTQAFTLSPLLSVDFDKGGNTGDFFYGKTKSLATYNRALTDNELYTITSTQYSAYSGMVAALGNYTIPC